MKEVVSAVRWRQIPCTATDAGRRSASENVVHHHSPSACGEHQDPVVTIDLCGVLPESH